MVGGVGSFIKGVGSFIKGGWGWGGEETEHRSHIVSMVATGGAVMSLTVTVSVIIVNKVHCSFLCPATTHWKTVYLSEE